MNNQMIGLGYLSAMHLTGEDAGDFLHNQVSADVLALAVGESTFACYCEPKGRVLALMLISLTENGYHIILSRALSATVAQRLKIYVMRAKVSIELLDGLSIAGKQHCSSNNEPEPIAEIPVPDSDKCLALLNQAPTATDPALMDAWKLAELKQGISWLCSETSGEFLPQMLGFDALGAVNFKKGCYPGQEIVARTHYLGKVKRHPRLVYTSAIVCPGPMEKVSLISGEETHKAIITDCGHLSNGGTCLFVVTRMSPDQEAQQLEYQGQLAPIIQN